MTLTCILYLTFCFLLVKSKEVTSFGQSTTLAIVSGMSILHTCMHESKDLDQWHCTHSTRMLIVPPLSFLSLVDVALSSEVIILKKVYALIPR